MRWYFLAFKNYANFKGRARRTEYWMFTLVNGLILLPLEIIPRAVDRSTPSGVTTVLTVGIISLVYALAVFLPSLALGVRRLHDINKSGAWISLALIAGFCSLIGFIFFQLITLALCIWVIVLMATDGTVGLNEFGDDPKQRQSAASEEWQKFAARITEDLKNPGLVSASSFGTIEESAVPANITGLSLSKTQAGVGESVSAIIDYENSEAEDKKFIVTLYVNGIVCGMLQVSAPANSRSEVSMPVSFRTVGEYFVKSGEFSEKIVILYFI